MKKRGKGKIVNCLGIRDMYKFYINKCKTEGKKPLRYRVFSSSIREVNKEIIRRCVEESELVRLPFRLGYLQICKYKRGWNKADYKKAVDWKKTKEEGFKVLHEQEYLYKWQWLKARAIVKNKTKYMFIACRKAKREVPRCLKLGIDYYGKPIF